MLAAGFFAAPFAATQPARAAAPVVDATLEPSLITMGQSAQLTITSSGNGMDAVKLPVVAGLELRAVGQSRHIQIINGAMLSTSSIIVRITPQAPGIYSIPGITSQPLELRVNPEGSANAAPGGSTGSGKSSAANAAGLRMTPDGSAFVRLLLPKRDIYVGESIPVDIEVGLRDGFARPNGMPALNGSDFTLNNLTHQPQQTNKMIDGKPFAVLTWHSVLAAIKPGKFSLAVETPLTVRIRTGSARESLLDDMLGDPFMQNFFGASVTKEVTVASPATELNVLELPVDGRPPNFSGAVGQFKISDDLSSPTAAAGDPVTLRMHVTGTGNFDRVDSTMLDHLDHWKTYPPKSSFKAGDALGNKGEKTFEQPLIAAQPGKQTLPPLTFSYFDPGTRRYETARSAPLEVTVSPSLAESSTATSPAATPAAPPGVAASNDGLQPDHAIDQSATRTLVPPYLQPRFLSIPSLMALAFAGGWMVLRRRAPQASGNRTGRGRGPTKAVDRILRDLQAAAHAGDADKFFTVARSALAESQAGTGSDNRDDGDDIRAILALADEARYAGLRPAAADFARWMQILRRRLVSEAGA